MQVKNSTKTKVISYNGFIFRSLHRKMIHIKFLFVEKSMKQDNRLPQSVAHLGPEGLACPLLPHRNL